MDPDAANFADMPWLAIGLSLGGMLVLGFLWYSPMTPTGRAWMRHMGLDPAHAPKPAGGKMAVSLLLMTLGSFFLLFVFAHVNLAYEDAFRNTATGGRADFDLRLSDTTTGAVLTWLGFIVPVQLNRVAFENAPWRIFAVDAGFYLVALLLGGILLATLG